MVKMPGNLKKWDGSNKEIRKERITAKKFTDPKEAHIRLILEINYGPKLFCNVLKI